MIPRFAIYLFDLDGTLVDSAADICAAQQAVLARAGRSDVPDSFLRCRIGRSLEKTFAQVFPEYSEEQFEPLIAEYKQIYWAREHAHTRPYPGVARMLAALGGRRSTATTKSTKTTRIVLEKFGLLPHFEHVQGTDGFPAKPAPDVILAALAALSARPEDCLFVGDTSADMEAGRRAGVRTCAALYGYGTRDEMTEWAPDYWIARPEDLEP